MLIPLKKRLVTLLRWSEKYTKTDMVYLLSRGSFSFSAQIITALATLVFAIVVGHVLSQETYGEYKYVLSLVVLLSFFSLNNIGGAVFQSTAAGYDGVLHRGFWANIRWSFAVFLGALGMALYYFFLHNDRLAAEILVGGCLSPFMASAGLYSSYLAGKKDFIRQTIYIILDNLFTTGIMIVAVLLTNDPLFLVIAYFVSNVLAALFFYRHTEKLYKTRGGVNDEQMLTYSKHLSILGILGGINDTLDQVLIFHFAGAIQAAIFAFATALPDQFETPVKTLSTMVEAGFVRRSAREIHEGIHNKIFWYAVFIICIIVVYVIAAPFIYRLLFPKYIASVLYSQIYVFWLLGAIPDPVFVYFQARKKIREQYILGIFSITFQITTMVIGVIWWGILGLIVAQVATRIISACANYALYTRVIHHDIATLS